MSPTTKRVWAAVAATTVLFTMGSTTGAGAAGQPTPLGSGSGQAQTFRVVTLVTGDRVTVAVGDRPQIVRIDPGKGRKVGFAVSQAPGRLRVIPRDALPGLRAGQLDPRLFDISTLLRFGYDDRRKDLPLIVTGQSASLQASRAATDVRGVPGGVAMKVAKDQLAELWNAPAARAAVSHGRGASPREEQAAPLGAAWPSGKLWLDGLRQPILDRSAAQIGAPAAWQAGYTGAGIKVAVVDSGIDATHPDLSGRVIAAGDFVGDGHDLDLSGHGTHVAATIGSNDTTFRGIAPGAQLLAAKVCLIFGCPESAILQGMQWSVEQGAKVINMSLGGADSPEIDPIEAAVNELTAQHGVLFVIAAGNAGSDDSIGSPGSADAALTVGAVDRADALAFFSSRGPRSGDSGLKPDITAPGVGIVAARGKDGEIGVPGELRAAISGTSMATPHVAGAAAILAQQHPQWTPAQLKAALMGSARPLSGTGPYAQGSGRADVAAAITQRVLADPPSVGFGLQVWPHGDDELLTRTVTYSNSGPAAVTLDLSLDGGPAGMFALSAATVTVAAGGSASVTLSADTRIAVPDGRYGGHLMARANGVTVSTPYAVDKEPERYNVSLTVRDRAGQPADFASTLMIDPVTETFVDAFGSETVVRVPRGEYVVLNQVFGELDISMLAEPEIAVHSDVAIELDARDAKLVSIAVPHENAARPLFVAAALVHFAGGSGAFFAFSDSVDIDLYSGSSAPQRNSRFLTGLVTAQYVAADMDPMDSPFLTEVAWRQNGRAFHGLTKRLDWRDLATIEARYASQGIPEAAVRFGPSWSDLPVDANPINLGSLVRLPSTQLEHHNTDDGLRWARQLAEGGFEATGNALFGPPVRFLPGKRYTEVRNGAVYGPGFSHPAPAEALWNTRRGNTMTLVPTLTNDQLNWSSEAQLGDYRITLDRNGVRLADVAAPGMLIDVPAGAATYRLGAEFSRGEPSTLSTKVSAIWTFRSRHVPGDRAQPLPMSAVRFLPALDSSNTAAAGRLTVLPIEVQRQPGSAAAGARTLSVDVSFDDGATWRSVPVIRFGQHAFAAVQHPAQAGFVSLRSRSTDAEGNTVEQTVLRAYRIA